jgi:hypothetical protein
MKIKIYYKIIPHEDRKGHDYGENLWFQQCPEDRGDVEGFDINPYITKSNFIVYKEWYFDGEKFTFFGRIS